MTSDLLDRALNRIAAASSFDDLESTTVVAARALVGADGATFVLRDGDNCFYAGEDAIAPLWKGQRFPLTECVSGWAMVHGVPAQISDLEADDRIPHDAYWPTFVRSLVMVPMGADPRGAVGVYWSRPGHTIGRPSLDALLHLAAGAGAAVERLGLHEAPWAPNFALRIA